MLYLIIYLIFSFSWGIACAVKSMDGFNPNYKQQQKDAMWSFIVNTILAPMTFLISVFYKILS